MNWKSRAAWFGVGVLAVVVRHLTKTANDVYEHVVYSDLIAWENGV